MGIGRHTPHIEHMSDIDLFAKLRGSRSESEAAFKELYRRHATRLRAYCHKVLVRHEDAEDVFQESFVRFYASARSEREMTNVVGFLFRIARNLCLNAKRDLPTGSTLEGVEIAAEQDTAFERSDLMQLIRSAVNRLELHLREAFVLRDYENMSYEQIGELLGATVPAVKSRVRRARKKVRALLAESITELQ